MRILSALLIALMASSPALAQPAEDGKPDGQPHAQQSIPTPAEQLDALYQRLHAARDSEEGTGIIRQIDRLHHLSPSPAASLLMERATRLIEEDDLPLASEMMERVLQLAPQWAEAWLRRAIVFQLTDDPDRTAAALLTALSFDPRYLDALEMLGALYANGDDDKNALVAYRKALEVYPASNDLQETVRKLSLKVEGTAL